jgi:site-specific DNA recombinase
VNPPAEWVTRDDEALRIVPDELWQRVKARQRQRTETIGQKIKAGVSRDRAQRTGRNPKYLFSGLLKCGKCGSNFVMAGRDHYACATRLNGGEAACDNDAYLRRSQIEPGLLAGIKRELSTPEVIRKSCGESGSD